MQEAKLIHTCIDNSLNIEDHASFNTSMTTYFKANTTMNNSNTNINIKTPTNTNSHIHIDMNTNTSTNRDLHIHLHILMSIKIHTTILKYRYILMHSCTNVCFGISIYPYTNVTIYYLLMYEYTILIC